MSSPSSGQSSVVTVNQPPVVPVAIVATVATLVVASVAAVEEPTVATVSTVVTAVVAVLSTASVWGTAGPAAAQSAVITKQLIVFSQSQFRALSDSVGKIPRSFILDFDQRNGRF